MLIIIFNNENTKSVTNNTLKRAPRNVSLIVASYLLESMLF